LPAFDPPCVRHLVVDGLEGLESRRRDGVHSNDEIAVAFHLGKLALGALRGGEGGGQEFLRLGGIGGGLALRRHALWIDGLQFRRLQAELACRLFQAGAAGQQVVDLVRQFI